MFRETIQPVVVLAVVLTIAVSGLAGVAAAQPPVTKNPGGDAPDPGVNFPDTIFDEHFPDTIFDDNERFPDTIFDEKDLFPDTIFNGDDENEDGSDPVVSK